jgi:glycosyltransferase involved in cell wall biosynthesis
VTFDLVVATVDRVDALGRLLASLECQTHAALRVLLVDQNDDQRLDDVVAAHGSLELERFRAERGLSRARNVALPHVEADVVAFPDDDCVYPPDLLERVASRLTTEPELDGLTGRAADAAGESSASWPRDAAQLTTDNLWNRAISFTIFLRAGLVERIGSFDEELGLGADGDRSSGEETDYLVRAVASGARIAYDPTLTVLHEQKPGTGSLAAREGASLGYILRKHHYPKRVVTRMLIRPAGGAVVALARRDTARARFQLETLRGRLRGYRS